MKKNLGDKLFEKVEKAQGFAFISDGISNYSKEELKNLIKNSKGWHKEAIRVLAEFDRKHLFGVKTNKDK